MVSSLVLWLGWHVWWWLLSGVTLLSFFWVRAVVQQDFDGFDVTTQNRRVDRRVASLVGIRVGVLIE